MSTRKPHIPLITISEAAEQVSCSPRTIRRWISTGKLKAVRYGPRMIRINPKDLDRLRRPVTPMSEVVTVSA